MVIIGPRGVAEDYYKRVIILEGEKYDMEKEVEHKEILVGKLVKARSQPLPPPTPIGCRLSSFMLMAKYYTACILSALHIHKSILIHTFCVLFGHFWSFCKILIKQFVKKMALHFILFYWAI